MLRRFTTSSPAISLLHQLRFSSALSDNDRTLHPEPLFKTSSPLSSSKQPIFLSKLREEQEAKQICFHFPSVLSMEDFMDEIAKFKRCASNQMKERQKSAKKIQQNDKNVDSFLRTIDLEELAEEISIKVRPSAVNSYLVAEKVWDLKMERLPLIPYQCARTLILRAISNKQVREYFEKFDCRYVEMDIFAQPKLFATNSSATRNAPHRMPCVAITGHINHGKTTLLDTLQQSNIVSTEPGLITQSIRAFTIHVGGIVLPNGKETSLFSAETNAEISIIINKKKKRKRSLSNSALANSPFKSFFSNTKESEIIKEETSSLELNKWKEISQITFIDTPGHRIFAEIRLHGSRLADVILLLISLEEGVQGQTEEIVRTVIHFKKPLVIAFSKVDLFTDPIALSKRLSQISEELRILGVVVRFVDSEEQMTKVLSKLRDPHYLLNASQNKYEATSQQKKRNEQEKQRIENNGVVEETVKIDEKQQNVTATSTASFVRQAIAICISANKGINISLLIRLMQRIAGHSSLPRASPSSSPTQAVVLESFRDFSRRNVAAENQQQQIGGGNNSNGNRKEGPVNIVALVRNGTLRTGMPFVCDMGWGVIEKVTNTWGDPLLVSNKNNSTLHQDSLASSSSSSPLLLDEDKIAAESLLPGAAIVCFGSKDTTCPGPLTHIIEVESAERAELISKFRNRQRFFIERHPALVHLLRPENKKSEFLYVGNYGQSEPELSFDYNVLVKEAKTPEVRESPLEARWRANQLKPEEQPKNEQEYSEHVKNSRVLSVLVRVDGYNSARTATREIPRLMTRNVVLNVISVGFGPITQKDVDKFGSVNIVVAFRAPRLQDSQAHMMMEMAKMKYGEFDVYSDMLEWLKKIVLDAQAEESAKRNPEALANREAQLDMLRAAGFLDEKRAKMRTAQQLTPSLEDRLNRKAEENKRDKF